MSEPAPALIDPVLSQVDQHSCRAPHSWLKRVLDIIGATGILAFIAPLMVLVAVLIVLDSRGPVFFRQRRTGLRGKLFNIYKFRSMHVMDDGHEIRQASQNDKRVTRVGGFLRRASIDELPQLLNVLKGDMSLVGPRPHAVAHDIEFALVAPNYADRFRVRPGLTGLAQVSGLRGEIHSPSDIVRRVEKDNAYADRWSIFLDVGILAKTFVVLPFQRSAY